MDRICYECVHCVHEPEFRYHSGTLVDAVFFCKKNHWSTAVNPEALVEYIFIAADCPDFEPARWARELRHD